MNERGTVLRQSPLKRRLPRTVPRQKKPSHGRSFFLKCGRTVSRVLSCAAICLDLALPRGSSGLPEARRAAVSLRFGLAPDGACTAPPVTGRTVVSYTAFSPLPLARRSFSVALSRGLPLPDVIRHPALWCPDFPRLAKPAAAACPATYSNLAKKGENCKRFSGNRPALDNPSLYWYHHFDAPTTHERKAKWHQDI